MRVTHVVGARPNFVKAAPVYQELAARGAEQLLIHTGQHYDEELYALMFQDLGLAAPDFDLGVGSGTHATQTAGVMIGLEDLLQKTSADWVCIYGDVNSTLGAALVCAKLRQPVAHVEAGLRSFDRSMPEEINRLLTDQVADLLFTPSEDADRNLLREGVAPSRIHRVGNVMIDSLVKLLPQAKRLPLSDFPHEYILTTLHRPENVDRLPRLDALLKLLGKLSERIPVVFPIHPRTRSRLTGEMSGKDDLHICDPLGYVQFLALEDRARAIITDSGGVQEEATFLGVPCFTLRGNTERPITELLGTNTVIGSDLARLETEIEVVLNGGGKKGTVPPLWDGGTSLRIAGILSRSTRN